MVTTRAVPATVRYGPEPATSSASATVSALLLWRPCCWSASETDDDAPAAVRIPTAVAALPFPGLLRSLLLYSDVPATVGVPAVVNSLLLLDSLLMLLLLIFLLLMMSLVLYGVPAAVGLPANVVSPAAVGIPGAFGFPDMVYLLMLFSLLLLMSLLMLFSLLVLVSLLLFDVPAAVGIVVYGLLPE